MMASLRVYTFGKLWILPSKQKCPITFFYNSLKAIDGEKGNEGKSNLKQQERPS